MKVCYFGDYNPEYSRNRVLLRGLRLNNVEVVECHTCKQGWKKYFYLYKQHKLLYHKYDIMIIGYTDSRLIIPFARIITRKKIIWDAFYSLYDSWVYDRKLINPKSLKAFYYWLQDWLACLVSNVILLDTKVHCDYFKKTFFLSKGKCIYLFIGADNEIFNSN